ncbi:hypothetical protein AK830_g4155 [Neonectria ditissima]|uniref:BTB domain-containing protein n=1 Tax=Neonectria ditissima TaxID=78410 RepID=A0A0P7BM29_9HYPO|nr:hypothetical protein AK830_g4155 [Neonectria ditissima]
MRPQGPECSKGWRQTPPRDGNPNEPHPPAAFAMVLGETCLSHPHPSFTVLSFFPLNEKGLSSETRSAFSSGHTVGGSQVDIVKSQGRAPIQPPTALSSSPMPSTRADAAKKADNHCFEESLASKPFLFVIGEERKEFHVHKEVIAKLSPTLNALVNGRMKEASEGRVEWPDLDVDTFVRFAKYAYSCDYAEAKPEVLARQVPGKDNGCTDVEQGRQASLDLGPATVDLTEEQDEISSSGSEDLSDSTSMSDEDIDDEDDEDEDGDGEDDDDSNEGEPGIHGRYSSEGPRSPGSSTLNGGQSSPDFIQLPYSIASYILSWESHRQNSALERTREEIHGQGYPQKRRRLEYDWICTPRNNLKAVAMHRFNKLNIFHPAGPDAYVAWMPQPNVGANQSFRPVFSSHARLYVLADKYGVEDLKALTLHRLHRTLGLFSIYSERIPDAVALIQIIYENTVDGDLARKVLVLFFCCIIEHARDCEEFRVAIRSQGDFADDLVQEMTSRLI